MPLYAITFVARNKDNKSIPDFKQRSNVFLTSLELDDPELQSQFEDFVAKGKIGELSRFYVAVNERNPVEVNKNVTIFLINNPSYNPARLPAKIYSISMNGKNALTKKWLFDFDSSDKNLLDQFVNDIIASGFVKQDILIHKSISGYHIIIPHGFDTRNIMLKWNDIVTLKRDDMWLKTYQTNQWKVYTYDSSIKNQPDAKWIVIQRLSFGKL